MGLRSLCTDAVIVNFLINPRDKYKTLISLRLLRRRFLPPKILEHQTLNVTFS